MAMIDTPNLDLEKIAEEKYRRMQAADLRQAINSPSGELTKWVLVEGKFDRDFYPIIFRDDVRVYMAGRVSEDDEKKRVNGGVRAVLEVVETILNDGYTKSIIGIIDRDYYDYRAYGDSVGVDTTGHVFMTDYRDLEMTLCTLSSAWDTISSLPEYNESLSTGWEEVIRYIGAIRVANRYYRVYESLEFSVGNLYNYTTHTIMLNWQDIVWAQVKKKGENALQKGMLEMLEAKFHLSDLHYSCYTRGHDAFKLLAIMLKSTKYKEASLVEKMIDNCTFADCKNLSLYKDISNWEAEHVEMLRRE